MSPQRIRKEVAELEVRTARIEHWLRSYRIRIHGEACRCSYCKKVLAIKKAA